MIQYHINQAARMLNPGLYLFMKEVGLRSITMRPLNHNKAQVVHGIPFTFHVE